MDVTQIERITYDSWRHSQLSIARFSGRISINGAVYIIDPTSNNDLVRQDVLRKEQKAKRDAKKAAKKP